MDQDALRAWALANGWQEMAGHLSLTKPNNPKEAVVRMVFAKTVVSVEAKKPAGSKWEKISSETYAHIMPDPETGLPLGLGFDKLPSFRTLMQDNKDRQVFASMGGPPKRR